MSEASDDETPGDTVVDLLGALNAKDHLSDVSLRGTDGKQVPAFRLLLAARSPVFERMFHGDFTESSDKVVDLPYDSNVIEKVLAHCISGSLKIHLPDDCDEREARGVATLISAAHFFELPELEQAALRKAQIVMDKSQHLACALYDETFSGEGETRSNVVSGLDIHSRECQRHYFETVAKSRILGCCCSERHRLEM